MSEFEPLSYQDLAPSQRPSLAEALVPVGAVVIAHSSGPCGARPR